MERKLYQYEGVVKSFDEIVSQSWYGYTYAASEKKARANLTYQYKCEHGLARDAKITLTGEIKEAT